MTQRHYAAPGNLETDIVVAGGRLAMVRAAIAATRNGARVVLVEASNALGGMGTIGLVPALAVEAGGTGGIVRELIDRLLAFDAIATEPLRTGKGHAYFNPCVCRMILLQAVADAGVTLILHARADGVETDAAGTRVTGVHVSHKGGRQLVRCQVAVDATGDGDLAAWAGAAFEKGREGDGQLQAVSLNFELIGVELDRKPPWEEVIALSRQACADGELELLEHMNTVHFGSRPTMYPSGFVHYQTDLAFGVDASDQESLTRGEMLCHERVFKIWQFLRKHVSGFERSVLVNVAAYLGVRESRRIAGACRLVEDDVLAGRKFDDGICRCSYYMDTHDGVVKTPEYKRSLSPPEGDFFEIPYGCLVPEAVDGLLVAGRCISSSHFANGAIRVQPTCMNTGQAAGTAAALCVQRALLPRELPGDELRAVLIRQGMAL